VAPWTCTYHGLAGARAHALFDTKDLAKEFAERHARTVAPHGTPVKWEDASNSTVLTTQLGDYLVMAIDQNPTRAQPPQHNRRHTP
jgi:hypothetical protein